MITIASWLYRLALLTRNFRVLNWFCRLLSSRGYTVGYDLHRGGFVYPIADEPEVKVEPIGNHTWVDSLPMSTRVRLTNQQICGWIVGCREDESGLIYRVEVPPASPGALPRTGWFKREDFTLIGNEEDA